VLFYISNKLILYSYSCKGGFLPEGGVLAGYYGFDAYISSTFQAVKNLSPQPTYLCSGLFAIFFGNFWVYLETESSLKGLVKFVEIGNFENLVLF